MYQVDDKPETIHLYVVREEAPKPQLFPIVLSLLALSVLVVLSVAVPYRQPVVRITLRIPAVPLAVKTFTTQATIVPTGVKTYPATVAHGVLTFTNGSIISQTLPSGVIFTTKSGVSITTDQAVFVPAGNANGYGYATVGAHAAIAGNAGNFPAYAIDQVLGSSVYVRNLAAFTGGRNSYSVTFVTAHDTQQAVSTAHHLLAAEATGLHYPCLETIRSAVVITWRCQFVTYSVPSYMRVLRVRLSGKNLLIDVAFTPPQVRIWVK